MQRIVIECMVRRGRLNKTLDKGLRPLAAYMDRCAVAGHPVTFDRSTMPWNEKAFRRSEEFDANRIEVLGMGSSEEVLAVTAGRWHARCGRTRR